MTFVDNKDDLIAARAYSVFKRRGNRFALKKTRQINNLELCF